jgi:OOP family OmpA-OmpF porin
MNTINYVLGAIVLAIPTAVQAQPINGIYIGAGAGTNWRTQINENGARGGRLDIGTEVGFVGVASVGYGFGNGLRVEIEGNYRSNPIGTTAVQGPNGVTIGSTSGSLSSYGGMANVLYDFNLAAVGIPTVSTYLGAGIGFAASGVSGIAGRTNTGTVANAANVSASGGGFAYQGIAGIAISLDQYVPGLALTTEYRYLASTASELSVNFNNGTTASRTNYTPNNSNQSALIGLRYAFNTPRPAPAPAPASVAAPAPTRTYLVFFDWDRADLTDRAREIIADGATNARTVASTRIEVSGHADRTGGAAYNQRLSVRRAEAVAAELVRRGIARNEITIQGFGFDRPLVATAMGVREPQNRRVEIVLR